MYGGDIVTEEDDIAVDEQPQQQAAPDEEQQGWPWWLPVRTRSSAIGVDELQHIAMLVDRLAAAHPSSRYALLEPHKARRTAISLWLPAAGLVACASFSCILLSRQAARWLSMLVSPS